MTNEGAHKQGRSAIFFSSFRFFGFVIFEGSQIPLLFAFPFHCGGEEGLSFFRSRLCKPFKGRICGQCARCFDKDPPYGLWGKMKLRVGGRCNKNRLSQLNMGGG